MKKILFTVCMALMILQTHAQFSIGFRTDVGSLTELNNIITQYNEARPWLDKKLGQQQFMNGIEFGFQTIDDKITISALKVCFQRNVSSVKGEDPSGTEFTRKLRTNQIGLEIVDAALTPIPLGSWKLGGGFMPIGLSRLRVRTKLNDEDWKKIKLSDLDDEEKETIWSSGHAYSTFHLDITNGDNLHFQTFYTLPWFNDSYELIRVNKEINPSTSGFYNRRTILEMAHIGFKLTLAI